MVSDPEVFGGFLLVRRIAESAMAGVYLAVRLGDTSGKSLVLKRPPLGERASGRAAQAILREAEVLGAVRGAGIPALEATGDIAGLPYVALERLRGESLARLLALGEPLSFGAVRALGKDIARALAKLHAAGWAHRDVTPSNIFVDDAGEAYLLDFGLCARAGDARDAVVAGTRGYVAPEAATPGAARPEQDVYGLAVCLAEAARGRRLFDEASLVEAAGRGDAPREIAALEAELPGISAALRRDPGARPSAAELESSLSQRLPGHDDAGDLPSLTESRDSLVALTLRARAVPDDVPSTRAAAIPERTVAAPGRTAVIPERTAAAPERAVAAPGRTAALAARVPAALTPTVPAVLPTLPDLTVLATLRDVSDPAHAAVSAHAAVPAPTTSRRSSAPDSFPSARSWSARISRSTLVVAVLLTLLALAIGFVSGRFSARTRGGSLSISGPLPRRTEVLLDSKKLTFAEGTPLPVPAGSHTLTLVSAKGARRDIPFTVRPGEHFVFLPTQRAPGSTAPLDDDSTP